MRIVPEKRKTSLRFAAKHKPNNLRDRWTIFTQRYSLGERRTQIFQDMILADATRMGGDLNFLDIGCGQGFDGSSSIQKSLAQACVRYIGIEPDPMVSPGIHIDELHRCTLDKAPIEASSINMAFAVMVLEHLEYPEIFWQRLHKCLAPNGVFWGFTMDARHFFCTVSQWSELLGVKNFYLNRIRGQRGLQRYENFPTWYRANTPQQITKYTQQFTNCDFINFAAVNELDYYVPQLLQPFSHSLAKAQMAIGRPGSILAIRLEK